MYSSGSEDYPNVGRKIFLFFVAFALVAGIFVYPCGRRNLERRGKFTIATVFDLKNEKRVNVPIYTYIIDSIMYTNAEASLFQWVRGSTMMI